MAEPSKVLLELGLTATQTKVLMALQKVTYAPIREIAKIADLHRQEIYRVLNELQNIGLVEKKISNPPEYKAVSLSHSVKILLDRKQDWMRDVKAKANKLIKEQNDFYELERCASAENTYFKLVTGLEMLVKEAVGWQINATTIDLALNYDPIWKSIAGNENGQIMPASFRYKKNAKIRLVAGTPPTENLEYWYSNKEANREVRFTQYFPANFGIYDGKIANFTIIPKTGYKNIRHEISTLVSNQPSFVNMLQNYFDNLWNNAKEYSE